MTMWETYVLYSTQLGKMYAPAIIPMVAFLYFYLIHDLALGRKLGRAIKKLRMKRIFKQEVCGLLKINQIGDCNLNIVEDNSNVLIDKAHDCWNVYSRRDKFRIDDIPIVLGLSDYASTLNLEALKMADYLKSIGINSIKDLGEFFYIEKRAKDEQGNDTIEHVKVPVSLLAINAANESREEEIEIKVNNWVESLKSWIKKTPIPTQKIKIKVPNVTCSLDALHTFVRQFTPQGYSNLVQKRIAENDLRRKQGFDMKNLIYLGVFLIMLFQALKMYQANLIDKASCDMMIEATKQAVLNAQVKM